MHHSCALPPPTTTPGQEIHKAVCVCDFINKKKKQMKTVSCIGYDDISVKC